MLKILTQNYIEAFSSKDIQAISSLLDQNFSLEDPVVKRIEGKQASLDAMQSIFNACDVLRFKAKNIYCEGSTTIIEFTLDLDETHLEGTDIIEWSDNKMVALRAYLDIPK